MGTRAARTLSSLAYRCLRRQLHSALGPGKQPLLSPGSSTLLSSPVTSSSYGQGRIDGLEQEHDLWLDKMMQLDPEATSSDISRKLCTKNPIASLLQSAARSQGRSTDEWSIDVLSSRVSGRVQHLARERSTEGRSEEAIFVRNEDFLSRYLEWRALDRSVCSPESRNYPNLILGAVNDVGIDGIISPSRPNCKSGIVPRLPQLSSLLNLYQEPSMIIPLEADSVKRKRKKKMNKHKQRKLRRRDRHRK